jgi:hypothetical protein
MDAVIRKLYIFCLLWISYPILGQAQQMNWARFTEDTLYYGKDYLPDHRLGTQGGPAQTWDFRYIKAPYAMSRRIIMAGERDGKIYANLVNGIRTDAILEVSGKTCEIIQQLEDNPVCPGSRLTYNLTPTYHPFFNGVLGETKNYRGRMISVFAWPRHMTCAWTPPQLPDTCRITLTISEEIVVDAEGTLYLPTEIAQVNRQSVVIKRAIRIETKTGLLWRDITSLVPGVRLVTTQSYLRFVTATSGLPLAEVELNAEGDPLSIEFKTHPMVTRVFAEEPTKPDIFAYPNPSYDVVRFQLSDLPDGKYQLKIFNILGVPVKDAQVDVDDRRETIALDLSDLQRGTYLFRLQDHRGRIIKTKRVVLIQS